MRLFLIILIVVLFGGCNQKAQTPKNDDPGTKLKEEAFRIAVGYTKSTLSNPALSMPDAKGIFSVSDTTKRIELDPNAVHIGLIDNDQNPDAIVSMIYYHANQTVTDHHLILLNKNGHLEQVADLEMNIRIIVINNGKITSEFHTKPRTSMYYNCVKCKTIVDYKFSNDSLIAQK